MPTFKGTPAGDQIRRFAWPLLVREGDQALASGTACVIGPELALTAKHVVADYIDRFGIERSPGGGTAASFQVLLHQQVGAEEFLWTVDKIWLCALTDAAVLHLCPHPQADNRTRPPWRKWKLSLFPPPPGTPIAAFGYHETSAEIRSNDDVIWRVRASTATGQVVRIHRLRRDSAMLRFPVFQLDARFDPSMSGGPVVSNITGELCGLIVSSLPPEPGVPMAEHISYAAALWPVMGTMIDKVKSPRDQFPLLRLAEDEVIHAPDWRRITQISISDDGHTVDLQVAFPRIDGVIEAATWNHNARYEVRVRFAVDGRPQGTFSLTATLSEGGRDPVEISSLEPEYHGPWDEERFAQVVREYLLPCHDAEANEIGKATPCTHPVPFRFAAAHLGRRM